MERVAARRGDSIAMVLRRRLAWPHPEWWALALSAVAWMSIATAGLFADRAAGAHHAHSIDLATAARDWMLMTLAMMVPLSIGAMQAAADRSLWRRRHRAIAGWLAGYVAIWLLVGVLLWGITTLPVGTMLSSHAVAAIAFLLAAAWQLSPVRARALARCHHVQPIAPSGWRADYDCVRYGWTTGVWCAMTCGVLMVACWMAGHGVTGTIAMSMATMIGLAERHIALPDPRWLAAPIAIMSVLSLLATS